jgi:alkanesulfonate monooxygenase SsuD/methylene tetrahydromethanopterin reductase-like flavin-dependent oxidoreductase (luciferase family)
VSIPGTIKAYPVARYVDPSNPRIMHERHVIYRREEDEHWRLASNARQQILVGNLMSDSRQERHAAPYAQELPNLLRKNQEEAQALNQTMQSQMQQNGALVDSIHNLAKSQRALNDRLGVVEKQLRDPNYRTQKNPAKSQPQPTQSPSGTPNGTSNGTPNGSPNVNPDGTFQSN